MAAIPAPRIRLRVSTQIRPQAELWRARERHLLYSGGIGSGKTYAGAIWALSRPSPRDGLICAPSHKQLEGAAISVFLRLAQQMGLVASRNSRWIDLITGSRWYIRSLHRPETISGLTLSYIWADELGLVRNRYRQTWRNLLGRLRGPEPCQLLATTTPATEGKAHWLYEHFIDPGGRDRRVWIVRSAENPHLEDGWVSGLEADFSEAFAMRELHGQWIDVGAVQVYSPDRLLSAPAPPPALVRTVRAWDSAATGRSGLSVGAVGPNDHTAGVLMSIDSEDRLYIRDMVRGQWDPGERDEVMRRTAEGDGRLVTISVPCERAAAGKSQASYWVRCLIGFRVVPLADVGDKIVRAGPMAGQIHAGRVTVTAEPGCWENYWHLGQRLSGDAARERFRKNLEHFPHGKSKDESDALASALHILSGADSGITVGRGRRPHAA